MLWIDYCYKFWKWYECFSAYLIHLTFLIVSFYFLQQGRSVQLVQLQCKIFNYNVTSQLTALLMLGRVSSGDIQMLDMCYYCQVSASPQLLSYGQPMSPPPHSSIVEHNVQRILDRGHLHISPGSEDCLSWKLFASQSQDTPWDYGPDLWFLLDTRLHLPARYWV